MSNIKEDAPANATGTAVAGTGDDSSTVVVRKKKKKPMQDKLMRRMGITETIDRVIPDLEYELDEITERKNQLKMMAAKDDNWVKDLALKSEGERALARDKDTDRPKKYVAGLSDKEKKSHDRHLEKQGKKSDSDKSAYKQSPADKVAKTKTSKFTKKYKQMYGEDMSIEEAIKGLQNKSKKSGMSYSILKKVYDRGMAAWKGGHRPGTTPQQWAFARVNSFVTKSSGTWGKADKDLANQVRGESVELLKNAWGEITEKDDKSGKELNNPTKGDVKKYKVYVRNDKGNVVKVEFGDPNMEIKRDDPARKKAFRARHNCDQKKDKTTAGYWSCKFWSGKSVTDLMKG